MVALNKVDYSKAFDRVATQITLWPGNQQAWPATGFVVAAVGPPSRGKSYTASVLKRTYKQRMQVFNAGDVRRVWEEMAKSTMGPTGLRTFFRLLRVPTKELASLPRWNEWLASSGPGNKAVWGDLFSTPAGAALNNFFASMCLLSAFRQAAAGKVAFFDATNTDMERRDAIVALADTSHVPTVFVENLCVNQQKLFRNFLDKVVSSGDYKGALAGACKTQRAIKAASARLRGQNLTSWMRVPGRRITGEAGEACGRELGHALTDILQRDLGYLRKYVPMHSRQHASQPSTIERINARPVNATQVGYLQMMIPECTPTGAGSLHVHTNLPMGNPMLDALVAGTRTSGSTSDTYSGRDEVAFDAQQLMRPDRIVLAVMASMRRSRKA